MVLILHEAPFNRENFAIVAWHHHHFIIIIIIYFAQQYNQQLTHSEQDSKALVERQPEKYCNYLIEYRTSSFD